MSEKGFRANAFKGCEVMREKDYYKEKIIEMVGKIKSTGILIYLYKIVDDITKEGKTK